MNHFENNHLALGCVSESNEFLVVLMKGHFDVKKQFVGKDFQKT